jgi:hypothetical protein
MVIARGRLLELMACLISPPGRGRRDGPDLIGRLLGSSGRRVGARDQPRARFLRHGRRGRRQRLAAPPGGLPSVRLVLEPSQDLSPAPKLGARANLDRLRKPRLARDHPSLGARHPQEIGQLAAVTDELGRRRVGRAGQPDKSAVSACASASFSLR